MRDEIQATETARLTLAQTLALTCPVDGPRDALPEQTAVLIVGAGPIGLTAFHLLAAHGIPCALIEKNVQTSALPKAIAVDDEYVRLLAGLGLADAVRAHASAPFGIHFLSAKGRPLVQVNAFHTPNGFGNRIAISQPLLEKTMLVTLSRSTDHVVCYGATLTGLGQDEAQVVATVDTGGEVRTIRARYLLACDGARSTVRSLLDIPFTGHRIDEPHLVVDLADFPDDTPASRFFCNPARPLNSIPAPFGGRRLEFMLHPRDDAQWLLSDEGLQWLIDHHSPYRGVKPQVIRRAVYGFSARIAQRLSQGRVFLLGDAAHVMPPFGGQGLNTGARDCANLAWKLAAVLRNEAHDSLLHTYDPERRGQIERAVRYSVLVGRVANIRSRPLAALRNLTVRLVNLYTPARDYLAQMRYMPRPRMDGGLIRPASGSAGHLVGFTLARFEIISRGRRMSVDEAIGHRHALIVVNAPTPWAPVGELPAGMPPIRVLALGTSAEGPDGRIGGDGDAWRHALRGAQGCAILVRPDRYVAAVARVDDCAAMLADYAAQFTSQAPVQAAACRAGQAGGA